MTHTHTHTQEGTVLHFTWEKDGNPMAYDDGDRVSLSNDTHSATIMFTSVVEDDAGIYQCMVTTEYEGLEAPLVSSVSINVTAIPGETVCVCVCLDDIHSLFNHC